MATTTLSVIGHSAAIFVLLFAHADPPKVVEPEPIQVQLVDIRPEAPVVTPPAPAPPEPVKPPPPPRIPVHRTPPRPHAQPIPADDRPTANGTDELSDAQVASAATVGSGSSGRACDMAQRLQAALRRDARVQAAVADAHSKALLVWNGDWVRHQDQDGNGMAAVREAIMWEVGFAPEACRDQPVRGLVLLTLRDGPGSARLVVGSGEWRWSDMLGRRGARRESF